MVKRYKASEDDKGYLCRAIKRGHETATTTPSGLPYHDEIINSDGASYELIVTSDTAEEAVQSGIAYLKANFDVVSLRVTEVPQPWIDELDITVPPPKTEADILWNNRPSEILSYARLLPMEERPGFSRRAVEHQGEGPAANTYLVADLIRVEGTDTLWLADKMMATPTPGVEPEARWLHIAFTALADCNAPHSEVESRQHSILDSLTAMADQQPNCARFAASLRRLVVVSDGTPLADHALDAFCGLPIETDHKAAHALDLAIQATEERFENAPAIVERMQRIILSSKDSGSAYRFAMRFNESADLPLLRAHIKEHMHPTVLTDHLADIDNLIAARFRYGKQAEADEEDVDLDSPSGTHTHQLSN